MVFDDAGNRRMAAAAKWAGRATAVLLLFGWGAFFVEHLSEWFLRSDGQYPPIWVWFAQAFHFGMLAGLAMSLRWEKAGSAVLLLSTAAFMVGFLPRVFPYVLLVNLVPAAFYATRWMLDKRRVAAG